MKASVSVAALDTGFSYDILLVRMSLEQHSPKPVSLLLTGKTLPREGLYFTKKIT